MSYPVSNPPKIKQITSSTFAGLSIRLHAVPPGAGAEVAALGIFTQEVAGLWRQSALVHVWDRHTERQE